MLSADAPRGYRKLGQSSLVVPSSLARTRQTWLKDEWKLIDRAIKLLNERGVKVTMSCKREGCSGTIERIDSIDPILECDCTSRVFTRAF